MARFNIKLVLEYKGADFHGWQVQPGLRTVQGELERVLRMVLRKESIGVCASGRTDSGVHARAQVANFYLDTESEESPDLGVLAHSVSHLLKGELSVLEVSLVPLEFNARTSALSKQYSYHILWRPVPAVLNRGFAWHVGGRLDLERMMAEAGKLVGEYDFTSFRGKDCTANSPVREVLESEFVRKGDMVIYRVVGRGFLKQMVRNIVGTLVWMGKGKIRRSMEEILQAKDRTSAGVTAPAYGLYLDWVKYPEGIQPQTSA